MTIPHEQVGRYARGHLHVAFAVVTIAVLSLLMSGVRTVARREPSPLDAGIPSDYLPGRPLARDLMCSSYNDYASDILACTQFGPDGVEYYVEYDTVRAMIVHTSKWVGSNDVRLGDLIAAWGAPTGITYSYISWGRRGVYAPDGNGMSPFNKVYLISYDLRSHVQPPWKGFVNREDSPFAISLPTILPFDPGRPKGES